MWYLLLPVIIYGLYVVVVLIFGTLNDFQPEEEIALQVNNNQSTMIADSAIVDFLIWNIGYGGLGSQSDFFLDGGVEVRPEKTLSNTYFEGISNQIASFGKIDFVLLQEVDVAAKRSYQRNQFQELGNLLPNHGKIHALNFNVKYVPKPLTSLSPIGKVQSGLATYSTYKVNESKRYQYPGSYGWPTRAFHLDRCFLTTRIPTANGNELVVINSHNSAYDGGKLKPLEMAYLKAFLLAEYEKGNYVVVGADWNQCPPNFDYAHFAKDKSDDYYQDNIATDYLPAEWQWVYDDKVPTNRKLASPYDANETFTTLIDFYLCSPNVKVLQVKGENLDFQFSDHQPVYLQIQLL